MTSTAQTEPDWRALLIRYMAKVIATEGITCIDSWSSFDLTKEESELLNSLEPEAIAVVDGTGQLKQ